MRYKNKNFNISIIEIKENNLDENINYLEMDNYLYNQEYEMYYKKDSIYIIQYENLENVSVSYGLIDNIYKTQIHYIGNINSNSKISLIFNLANYKLIGIHEKNSNYYNKGIFFNCLIDEFINKYKYINEFKNKNKYRYFQTFLKSLS